MDTISSEKRSSNIKKKANLTVTDFDVERSSVPISEPHLENSGSSSVPISVSHPSTKPLMHLKTSLGKSLSIKKKLVAFTQDDSKLANISCSNLKPAITSRTIPGKASDDRKIIDSANRDGVNSTKDLSSRASLNPSPCSSISSETSTSTTTTITTTSLKPNDPKTSGGGPSTSQRSCSNSQRDSLNSYSSMNAQIKRHTGHDSRWEAIQIAISRAPPLGLGHFKLLKRLGYGDIGSVYLVELKGTNAYFAMKVMDKASITSRNKLIRAQTEREILTLLDHPFLPTLYSHFETDKFYCLVLEYCSGGNLHSLRQKQPYKYFTEQAARFYASEVLLALEYLHMLGIVYRDLKPENVLVREEGHIMLSDFDLSLQCSVKPTLVKSSSLHRGSPSSDPKGMLDTSRAVQGCIQPTVFFPRIISKKNRKSKSDLNLDLGLLPELIAEPTNARSMSFVGTHEYLAPEIIRGEGHGSAVDWWTFGIFIYELIYGTTPFKGSGNRATLFNVIGRPLRFPEEPVVSTSARDLIRSLLVKDPEKRIACRRGAAEIKQHQFFDGVNWALVRSTQPPHVPELEDFGQFTRKDVICRKKKAPATAENGGKSKQNHTSQLHFEYF